MSLTHRQRCNRCILPSQPIEPASLRVSYHYAEMQSVYSKATCDWASLVGAVLPFCRDAIGVFYNPSRLGLPRCGCLTPLQKCNRCTLQPQVTGQALWGQSYPSAEIQSVYSTAPASCDLLRNSNQWSVFKYFFSFLPKFKKRTLYLSADLPNLFNYSFDTTMHKLPCT